MQATQGRLRALLRANQAVASAVELDDVLSHILDAARRLVDARYAALGVVDRGRLVRFLHTGMDQATVTAIGHLPEGKGLLGRLIDFPTPLRLPGIGDHPSSVGFPDNHPPMRSFLGVPIRVGETGLRQPVPDRQAGRRGVQPRRRRTRDRARRRRRCRDHQRRCDRRVATAPSLARVDGGLSTAVLTSDNPDEAPRLILRHATATVDCIGGSVVVSATETEHVHVAAADGVFTAVRSSSRTWPRILAPAHGFQPKPGHACWCRC